VVGSGYGGAVAALRFAEHCEIPGSASLRVRLERLLRDAERAGLELAPELERNTREPVREASRAAESALRLEPLCEACAARAIWLYTPSAGALVLAGAYPAADAPHELLPALDAAISAARRDRASTRADVDTASGRLHIRVLRVESDGESVIVGALVLEVGAARVEVPDAELRAAARALLAQRDVDPLHCLD